MLGIKKKKKSRTNQVSTVVGQGTEIRGEILFSGRLHIDGKVKGDIKAQDDGQPLVSLSNIGMIEGDVNAPIISLNGTVKGNIYASERVELAVNSKVMGDVSYNIIEIAEGAEVNGRLVRMQDQDSTSSVQKVSLVPQDKSKAEPEKERKNRTG